MKASWGSPGGLVGKTPPANAGGVVTIPGPGGSHMPQRSSACGPQVTSLGPAAGALQQEKTRGPRVAARVAGAAVKSQRSQKRSK